MLHMLQICTQPSNMYICMTPAGAASSKWNPFGIRRVTARARATQRKCDKRRDEESKALCLRMLRHQNWVPISHRSLVFVFFFCVQILTHFTNRYTFYHPPPAQPFTALLYRGAHHKHIAFRLPQSILPASPNARHTLNAEKYCTWLYVMCSARAMRDLWVKYKLDTIWLMLDILWCTAGA